MTLQKQQEVLRGIVTKMGSFWVIHHVAKGKSLFTRILGL